MMHQFGPATMSLLRPLAILVSERTEETQTQIRRAKQQSIFDFARNSDE